VNHLAVCGFESRKANTNFQMNTKGISNKYLLLPHKRLGERRRLKGRKHPSSDIKRGGGLGTRNVKMNDCASLQRRTERYGRIGLTSIARQSPLPIMKSRQVHRLTKIKLYETIIGFVTWYVSEAWSLSQTAEKKCLMYLREKS
jgi:hypothetical protein